MISELIDMKGNGLYVWSAFSFTLLSFSFLYLITKNQFIREKNKFLSKYETLDSKKARIARSQAINKEILLNSQSI